MNNPKSFFTRTAILMSFLVLATASHYSVNAQTRLSKSTPIMKAQTQNSGTWYFEGLKMSAADEKTFLSLLKSVDPRAYSIQEVNRGRAVRTYGKSSPAQVQLVKKTIAQQGATKGKGGIFRHKVHTDDKFSESTFIWLKTPSINAALVGKIDKLMAKYQGPNVVKMKPVRASSRTIRQK